MPLRLRKALCLHGLASPDFLWRSSDESDALPRVATECLSIWLLDQTPAMTAPWHTSTEIFAQMGTAT